MKLYKMNSTDKDNKISYINFLQSFALVLVIIGHCLPKANLGDVYPLWAKIIHQSIYSFHMPLFFILAGFLFSNSLFKQSKTIESFQSFLFIKFKRLIIPYFTIGTLAYVLKVFVFNKFAYRPVKSDIVSYIKSMLIPWDNPNMYLWFLPTIFFIFILSYLILKAPAPKKPNFFVLISFGFFISFLSCYTSAKWFNISGILNFLFYFLTGVLFFSFKDRLFVYLSDKALITFAVLIFFELQILPPFQFRFCNFILTYIAALSGIFISFALAYYFDKHNLKFMWGKIDGKYYQIYLLSWFFQCGARIFYQLHIINYPSACILMFVSSLIFPVLITNFIKTYAPKLKIFIGL